MIERNPLVARLFKVCPRTHRIMSVLGPDDVPRKLFPIAGLLALVWFLVRVVPKPSRATYPCQRVAAPLASSFVLSLAGFVGAGLLCHQARFRLRHTRYLSGALALVGALVGLGWVALGAYEPAEAYPPHTPNAPIGTARGLAPGRVTWVHDPNVTDWAGPDSGETWWTHIDQNAANAMLTLALKGYTDAGTPAAAWDAIFRHFNGGSGYSAGQKIFIKINLTTSYAASNGCADPNYNWPSCDSVTKDSVSNSPQMMHALLDQLVNVVGVSQGDITIGDPTGLFTNILYTPLHNDFPNVHYLDNRGTLGRTRAEFSTVPFYWSNSAADGTTQDKVPSAIADASYMINFAVLKTHNCGGITVMGKNLYGALIRTPDGYLRGAKYNYFDIHEWLPGTCSSNYGSMGGMGHYRALTDLLGHKEIGGKTVLYLIDAIFGGKDWNARPAGWTLSPFGGNWPASLFLSMDPVAIDSVAFDFLSQRWPDQALQNEGVQDYMHEAAQANNPRSGSFYDPERDGVRMASLGVHEHWNNPTQKQYSRNLGSGSGIELVYMKTAYALAVNKAGTGSGKVTSSPAGINCGATCTADFPFHESVTLTASPASGSAFNGWSGACTGTGSCMVQMTAAQSVTAAFALTPSTIGTTTSLTTSPNLSVEGGEITVTFAVTPNAGSSTPSGTVTVSDGSATCSATVAAGSCRLTLFNPETKTLTATYAGDANHSGSSGTVSHTLTNLVPMLATLSHPSSTAGGPGFVLTVTGEKFIPGTTIHWKGSSRTTTFVSPTQLTAPVASVEIAVPGIIQITVKHPGSHGDISNALTHTIAGPTQVFPLFLPLITR